ncbi:MAG: hypothetical protein IJ852_00840 [Alphaproteobacteria bacterium]|nr:hypothetical protein [Alphaproteobacteria bacterium]
MATSTDNFNDRFINNLCGFGLCRRNHQSNLQTGKCRADGSFLHGSAAKNFRRSIFCRKKHSIHA